MLTKIMGIVAMGLLLIPVGKAASLEKNEGSEGYSCDISNNFNLDDPEAYCFLKRLREAVEIKQLGLPTEDGQVLSLAHDTEGDKFDLCTNNSVNLARELSLWDQSDAITVAPSSIIPTVYGHSGHPYFNHLPANFPIIPLAKRVALNLNEQSQVDFILEPTKNLNMPQGMRPFGGIAIFEVPEERGGIYRFSFDSPYWIDVVMAEGGILPRSNAVSQHNCPTIMESVEFQMSPGKYALQISSALIPIIELMVTKAF